MAAELFFHCLVTWNSETKDAAVLASVRAKVEGALAAYDHMNVYRGVYVVRIASTNDWLTIVRALQSIAASSMPTIVYTLVSPPLPAGTGYNGWLPPDTWKEIAKLSGE